MGGRSILHSSASPRHSVSLLQGWWGGSGCAGFSLKHSRTPSTAAGFSPKQKPRGASHRANPTRQCSLPQTFQLESVRVSLGILSSAAPGRDVINGYLWSKNSPVPAALQNRSFPGRWELSSCYQSRWMLSKTTGNLGTGLRLCIYLFGKTQRTLSSGEWPFLPHQL